MVNKMIPTVEPIDKIITLLQTYANPQLALYETQHYTALNTVELNTLFNNWAAVDATSFCSFLTKPYLQNNIENSKEGISKSNNLFSNSEAINNSSSFITIIPMEAALHANAGKALQIFYTYTNTTFGKVIVAATTVGICYIAFYADKKDALRLLQLQYKLATYTEGINISIQLVINYFANNSTSTLIPLHIKGSPFQLKIWQHLLSLPMGKLTTYAAISKSVANPKAARAVGTAIGSNKVAYLIPCHRVVLSTGSIGGYRWGKYKKMAIIGWEAAKCTALLL